MSQSFERVPSSNVKRKLHIHVGGRFGSDVPVQREGKALPEISADQDPAAQITDLKKIRMRASNRARRHTVRFARMEFVIQTYCSKYNMLTLCRSTKMKGQKQVLE